MQPAPRDVKRARPPHFRLAGATAAARNSQRSRDMRAASEQLTPFARVAQTAWLTAPPVVAARAAAQFVWTARRLPTVFRTPMVAHDLSPRLPAPASLHRLVAQLRGRLAVANPIGAARIPGTLAAPVRAVVRDALAGAAAWGEPGPRPAGVAFHPGPSGAAAVPQLGAAVDARAARERRLVAAFLARVAPETRDRLRAGVARAAVALYEATAPTVRIQHVAAAEAGGPGEREQGARAVAELRYRLAVVVGADAPPADWRAVDRAVAAAPAFAWPPPIPGDPGGAPWFVGQLLVPDVWLAAHADAATLARWAQLTGRAGGGRDGYWFPESWERFLEAGRGVGYVTPADVWRPRRGGYEPPPPPDDALPWTAGSLAFARSPLTPESERGVCVPPGYALVHSVGMLDVTVVAV